MIVLIVYIIGVFLTPVIIKKFYELPTDEELLPLDRGSFLVIVSILWPVAIVIGIFYKLAQLLLYIYNKV